LKPTVILSTYNKPEYLKLALQSQVEQNVLPFEIIVADDGSTDETRKLVIEFSEKYRHKVSIRHVWHEDTGFRRSAIVNEAVRVADGDYLIFSDGDCMAHPDFVRNHIKYAERGTALSGKRVEISRSISERLLSEGLTMTRVGLQLLIDSIHGDSRRVEEGIIISNQLLRRVLNKDIVKNIGMYGCNCSLHKDLYMEVNGYDEDFRFSVEDNDLGIRVINAGKRLKSVRALAIVFHIWHSVRWTYEDERYDHDKKLLQQRIDTKQAYCLNGIVKRT
jgi:glycosyltransferase involved in cell wall biosynthesis